MSASATLFYIEEQIARAPNKADEHTRRPVRGGAEDVIEAVERRSDPSVREMMRSALKAQVDERPDGVIEVDPRIE